MTTYHHSIIARDPRQFGRGRRYLAAAATQPVTNDELRLFVMTFGAGFVFTSLFLA